MATAAGSHPLPRWPPEQEVTLSQDGGAQGGPEAVSGRRRVVAAPGDWETVGAEPGGYGEGPRPGDGPWGAELVFWAGKAGETKPEVGRRPDDSVVSERVLELKQSVALQKVHPNVLAKVLRKSLLHEDKDFVVIDKPYGIPVHGGPGVRLSLADVLPVLAKMMEGMKAQPFHLCHRLDKETTGVMALGRNQEAAQGLQQLFRTRQVTKPVSRLLVDWGITFRGMGLSPLYRTGGGEEGGSVIRIRGNRDAFSAVTKYRILESSGSCALVEMQPITGVKHQLRVHAALALNCPILGDHKYSTWAQLVPQRLPDSILRRLQLTRSKTRHIPLHLHACELSVSPCPSMTKGLSVRCRPPKFFRSSLRRLNISPPKTLVPVDTERGDS
uniref:Pseudouridylate synthase RPUSD4, mitochondrial n=1 Tax=Callorhinchus milii TaxID=7868 RepID=A0A4W3HFG9_CALMI